MKLKKLPTNDTEGVAMLIRILKLEDESAEDEPFEEGTIPTGTYAMDSQNRVWRLDDTLTLLFGGFKEKK